MPKKCPSILAGLIADAVCIALGIERDSDQGKLIFAEIFKDQGTKQTFGKVTRQELVNYITFYQTKYTSLDLTTANEMATAAHNAAHDEKADPGNVLLEIDMWRNDKKTLLESQMRQFAKISSSMKGNCNAAIYPSKRTPQQQKHYEQMPASVDLPFNKKIPQLNTHGQ